ncbi:hypothetical protein [Streptomyces sp. CBMA156]|uniref:hypothetical protein n=1 Tax=Streptomyces sp. CBMA156 TaxID=1930280 RepID=UPI001661DD32|nr:hypothetical protein [Streptomyces sp. CBMA156]MBD0670041.1 hypothetical protein [Streptomyces sp. CBMA156]
MSDPSISGLPPRSIDYRRPLPYEWTSDKPWPKRGENGLSIKVEGGELVTRNVREGTGPAGTWSDMSGWGVSSRLILGGRPRDARSVATVTDDDGVRWSVGTARIDAGWGIPERAVAWRWSGADEYADPIFHYRVQYNDAAPDAEANWVPNKYNGDSVHMSSFGTGDIRRLAIRRAAEHLSHVPGMTGHYLADIPNAARDYRALVTCSTGEQWDVRIDGTATKIREGRDPKATV